MILSLGSIDLAKRNAIVKDLPSVETLGFTSAINSDKTGTLTMNQMTAVEVVAVGDRYTITGSATASTARSSIPSVRAASIEDAILPYLVANDAKLVDGKVVGDPTEGALLVLAYKAGLDIEATREQLPRLATLPFDPTYKLMATFNSAVDGAGRPVVRCFVKGAAPAVMERAGDRPGRRRARAVGRRRRGTGTAEMVRLEQAGYRVMAAATRDLDPASFDADGDLLAYATDLQMTSLVGMVDPPRDESKAAVAAAQAAHIRVRMVTGDDVTTGAAIAEQLGIPGEAMLGADFAALSEAERLARIDDIGVVGRVAPEHKVLARRHAEEEGRRRRDDRRRRQRRARHQGRRHRHRHGQRHRRREERRSDDPLRRQLRHHRLRGRTGPQDLRQPHEVHPLRARTPRRVRADVPRRDPLQHRRR